MSARVKPAIILGLVIPPLCLLVILVSSIQLYEYTQQTFHKRLAILEDGETLTQQLKASVPERSEIRMWRRALQEAYDRSNIDGFLNRLTDSPTAKPELTSSSSINPTSYAKLRPLSAQQLTLIGGLNSLIGALSRAECSFPAALLFHWTLKKASKRSALQFETQLLMLAPPSTPSGPSGITITNLNIHAPHFMEAAALFAPQATDAFGLAVNQEDQTHHPTYPLATERPSLSLATIASQLSLQGLAANEEAIINTYLLHAGEKIHLRYEEEHLDLVIHEIRENGVLLGWSRSDETYFLTFPDLPHGLEVSTTDPNIFSPDEIALPTPRASTAKPGPLFAQSLTAVNRIPTNPGPKP